MDCHKSRSTPQLCLRRFVRTSPPILRSSPTEFGLELCGASEMASCYRMVGTSSGTQIGTNPIDVPCPGPAGKDGHSQCCVTGDTCLSNGICHFTHASTGGSGYYTSACTDRTLNSSACAQACRRYSSWVATSIEI